MSINCELLRELIIFRGKKTPEICIAKYTFYSFLLPCFLSESFFSFQVIASNAFYISISFTCECAFYILLTQNILLQCNPHSKLWTRNIQVQIVTVTCLIVLCKYRSFLNILNIVMQDHIHIVCYKVEM